MKTRSLKLFTAVTLVTTMVIGNPAFATNNTSNTVNTTNATTTSTVDPKLKFEALLQGSEKKLSQANFDNSISAATTEHFFNFRNKIVRQYRENKDTVTNDQVTMWDMEITKLLEFFKPKSEKIHEVFKESIERDANFEISDFNPRDDIYAGFESARRDFKDALLNGKTYGDLDESYVNFIRTYEFARKFGSSDTNMGDVLNNLDDTNKHEMSEIITGYYNEATGALKKVNAAGNFDKDLMDKANKLHEELSKAAKTTNYLEISSYEDNMTLVKNLYETIEKLKNSVGSTSKSLAKASNTEPTVTTKEETTVEVKTTETTSTTVAPKKEDKKSSNTEGTKTTTKAEVTTTTENTTTTMAQKSLPSTGSNMNYVAIGIGALLLIAGTVVLTKKKK